MRPAFRDDMGGFILKQLIWWAGRWAGLSPIKLGPKREDSGTAENQKTSKHKGTAGGDSTSMFAIGKGVALGAMLSYGTGKGLVPLNHGGKPTRRIRSLNLGSERRESYSGAHLSKTSHSERR